MFFDRLGLEGGYARSGQRLEVREGAVPGLRGVVFAHRMEESDIIRKRLESQGEVVARAGGADLAVTVGGLGVSVEFRNPVSPRRKDSGSGLT